MTLDNYPRVTHKDQIAVGGLKGFAVLLVVRPSTEEKIYIDQNLGCSFLRIQDIVGA